MLEAIAQDGQPREASWPYLPALLDHLADWRPPAEVGELFRRASCPGEATLAQVRHWLEAGYPVMMATTVSGAFFQPDAEGVIARAEPLDPGRCHAVLAAGYGQRDQALLILVRNSWGAAWGLAGYAWLSDAYLAPRLEALAMMAPTT
jgi:hypothetical protein